MIFASNIIMICYILPHASGEENLSFAGVALRRGKEGLKMEEFIEKVKNGASKMFAEAEKLTGTATQKTGAFVSRAKLNYAVTANENKIKDICEDIGKSVYEEYKSGSEFPEPIAEKLKEIDTLYDEVTELKTKIADLKNSVICGECGEYNSAEGTYCSKCGVRLK